MKEQGEEQESIEDDGELQTSEEPEYIPNNLEKLREERNLDIGGFAEFLGFEYTTYVGWENGAHLPDKGDRSTICQRLKKQDIEIWPTLYEILRKRKERRRLTLQRKKTAVTRTPQAPVPSPVPETQLPDKIVEQSSEAQTQVPPGQQKTPEQSEEPKPEDESTINNPTQSVPPSPFNRRQFITYTGIGAAAVFMLGGGIVYCATHRPMPPTSTPRTTPTATRLTTPTPLPPIGTLLYTYHGHPIGTPVSWSPDSARIASGNSNGVEVWYAATGNLIRTYRGYSGDVTDCLAWSPNSSLVASGTGRSGVHVWDGNSGTHLFTYKGHSSFVSTVAWSPDAKQIASGGNDKTVQIWDAQKGILLHIYHGHSDEVTSVAWSPNGTQIVSGSHDKTVQIWDVETGITLHTYHGHTKLVVAVAWSPDGKYIASGSFDNTVQIWDAKTGFHVFTYTGHSSYVDGVAWSPNSKRIASVSFDETVQMWDAISGKNALKLYGHSDVVNSVAWSRDGSRIASGSYDGIVKVWQAS